MTEQHGPVEEHGPVEQHGPVEEHGPVEQHGPVEEHGPVEPHKPVEQHGPVEPHGQHSGAEEQPQAGTAPRRRGNRRAGSAGATGLVPVKAKEDDPRVWGDSPEDRDSWLLEQRPPHWG